MKTMLLDIPTILTFMISTALIVAVPGPSVLMIVAAGVAGGRRAAIGSVCAIIVADLILIGLVAGGMVALAEFHGTTINWLSAVGGLILVVLGWRMVRTPGEPLPSRPTLRAHAIGSFVATLANPKSLLFFAAFLPQFVDFSRPVIPQYFILAVLFVLAGAPVALVYALGAERLAGRGGPLGQFARYAPRIAGLCLIALGATGMLRGLM